MRLVRRGDPRQQHFRQLRGAIGNAGIESRQARRDMLGRRDIVEADD